MKEEKLTKAFLLSCLGAVLILINGLIIALNGAPLMVSSGSIAPEMVLSSDAPLWWRISFGFRGLVEGPLMILWLIFAVIILFSALMFYIKPIKRKTLGMVIIAFSILSIPTGGGFIIGLILAIIGGGMVYEWPKPARQTFLGRLIRVARLDPKMYSSFIEELKGLKPAAFTIIFVNILSGLGIGLYSFNARKILDAATPISTSTRIILFGDMFLDQEILVLPITFVGIAVVKWIILSGIMYIIGVKIIASKSEFEKIGRAIALAYAPISLQFFMPFIFTSKPNLAGWPLTLFLITNLWMILALVIGLKQCLDISLGKSLGVVSLGGSIYWLTNQLIFVKAFGTSSGIPSSAFMIFPLPQIPGIIQFAIEPPELVFMFMSVIIILAILLGVFTKH